MIDVSHIIVLADWKQPFSISMAIRPSRACYAFGSDPETWLRMQITDVLWEPRECDDRIAVKRLEVV